MVLAAAAWIVLILGLRLSSTTTWIALSASVAPIIFAAMSWSAVLGSSGADDGNISAWLWLAVDVPAVVVFLVLCWANRVLSRRDLLGLAFVLWGATAFGAAHFLVEFFTMIAFNEYNWDTPPGTGWITVAVLVIAGSASFWFGGQRQEPPAGRAAKSESLREVPLDSTVTSDGD